jgi:DNA-binding protein H-NS
MLAAAWRKVSRRATVAWQKRNVFIKILTQENCGPQKEVTTAGRKVTHGQGVARSKKYSTRDNTEHETWKG